MSFLDRLKREADQQRLQAEQTAREREERESRYRNHIEPKMKALTQYLEGLVATLQEVRPPIVIRMAIQGYGDLCTVPFWDYKVEPERRHRSYLITMTWSLRVDPERTPVVRADGVTRVKALTSVFRQHMLAGIKEEKRTPQGEISLATFHARGYVKAKFTAQISADDPILRLVFENASWLGSSRRQVNWDQVDDTLFDRIARFIVREDDSLFTEELTEELKQKLGKAPASAEPAPAPVPAPAPPQAIAPIGTPPPAAPADFASRAPAPAIDEPLATDTSYIPSMIPAPAPVTEGDVIEIDESKLGLDNWQEDDAFGAFSLREPTPAPPAPPTPAPVARSIPPVAAPAAPAQPVPAPPAPAPAARQPPAEVRPPVPPAATPAAAPRPSLGAPQAPAPAPVAPAAPASVAAPPPAPAPAPAATAAPAPAVAPAATTAAAPAPAAAAVAPKAEADEDADREAALFRLKVRAMLARMRTNEEPGKTGG